MSSNNDLKHLLDQLKYSTVKLEEAEVKGNEDDASEWKYTIQILKHRIHILKLQLKAKAFDEICDIQGEFDCRSSFSDFYDDVVEIIHKYQSGDL